MAAAEMGEMPKAFYGNSVNIPWTKNTVTFKKRVTPGNLMYFQYITNIYLKSEPD